LRREQVSEGKIVEQAQAIEWAEQRAGDQAHHDA